MIAAKKKRMTAEMWPEVFAKSRWKLLGESSCFPHEKGVKTMEFVSEDWGRCPSCGYVPLAGLCGYCRKVQLPVTKLESKRID